MGIERVNGRAAEGGATERQRASSMSGAKAFEAFERDMKATEKQLGLKAVVLKPYVAEEEDEEEEPVTLDKLRNEVIVAYLPSQARMEISAARHAMSMVGRDDE